MKIVSGGQSGVDRAALDAALALGLECGGWCPKGRLAEDGPIPERYPLKETSSNRYAERTRLNVRDSDATLIITRGEPSGGTEQTVQFAREMDKPVFVARLDLGVKPEDVSTWLREHAVQILNVAGPRESGVPGISAEGKEFLSRVLGEKTKKTEK